MSANETGLFVLNNSYFEQIEAIISVFSGTRNEHKETSVSPPNSTKQGVKNRDYMGGQRGGKGRMWMYKKEGELFRFWYSTDISGEMFLYDFMKRFEKNEIPLQNRIDLF